MAYVQKLFNTNFLEYASYVIKDRAIPHVNDGLKPVQRRILHSLFEMDDGKFNKVANVVGHCMKYHPHGDASIYSALVVLANKDLFIDKQGNFGNIYTGDPASAARYIECRLVPFAKEVLYNPELTAFDASYDGRNKEPVTFPAKIPILLIQGAEGIAVGMATKILPHNFVEVLKAVKAALKGRSMKLYPDFPTGGMIDVSGYQDGLGKVLVRAKLDISDSKRIIIKEVPFGSTTESLINSIENAARANKIKIASINDFTTEDVEIEIKMPRGVQASDVVDGLYAFTDCESSISVNLLVIKDNTPVIMTVTEVIKYHAQRLVSILKGELKLEEAQLLAKLHAKTLEQIFVEERIYKKIETMKTHEDVYKAIKKGFKPFAKIIKQEVTDEDIERLLKIPIRRISLYDINKAKKEIRDIKARLKQIREHLKNLINYSIAFVDALLKKEGGSKKRKSQLMKFEKVDVKEAAQRHLRLKYDESTGYLGYGISSGKVLFEVHEFDRILVIRKTGSYSVIKAPDKLFVDKGMLFCNLAEKDILEKTVFSVIYKDKDSRVLHLKRCQIEKFVVNRGYTIIPENTTLVDLAVGADLAVVVNYTPRPRLKVLEERFPVKKFLVKSLKAAGVRLSSRDIENAKFVKTLKKGDYAQPELGQEAPSGSAEKKVVKKSAAKKTVVKKEAVKKVVKKKSGKVTKKKK